MGPIKREMKAKHEVQPWVLPSSCLASSLRGFPRRQQTRMKVPSQQCCHFLEELLLIQQEKSPGRATSLFWATQAKRGEAFPTKCC